MDVNTNQTVVSVKVSPDSIEIGSQTQGRITVALDFSNETVAGQKIDNALAGYEKLKAGYDRIIKEAKQDGGE